VSRHLILHTDGGAQGNPGPAAAAYVLTGADGRFVEGRGIFIGEATNNVAEYNGLIEGLRAAARNGATAVTVRTDSELMARQINGLYKVKNAALKDLHAQCMQELAPFASWRVEHVPREQNERADRLAARAIDLRKDVKMAPPRAKSPARQGRRLRLAVLISGGGTTLVNLDKEIKAGRLNAEIAVVVSSRSTVKGIARAREIGLEPVIIRRKDFDDVETFSARLVEVLDSARIDLVIQAGWLCLWRIPPQYEWKVMNIHPALLPSFGGQGMWGHHVHEAVLKAGCKVSGCTVHFANNEYDAGPIIIQRTCEVGEDDTPDTLAARVFREECIAYPEAIRLFAQGRLAVEGQRVRIRTAAETDGPPI